MRNTNLLLALVLLCTLGLTLVAAAEEPKTGEKRSTLLYVRTVPPGAKILLDGKELGKSDDLFSVEPGVGKIVVELNGYQADSKQVTIKANEVTRIVLNLKQTGTAAVSAEAAPSGPPLIRRFPITTGLITKDGISVNNDAWKIESKAKRTVRLFEVPDPGVKDCMVIYRAKMKTEDLEGQAYFEMWCRMPGGGEFFSKGLQNPVSGTTGWATYEIPYFLKEEERLDLIKLNVVIEGKGTLWIKDVELLRGQLPASATVTSSTESTNNSSAEAATDATGEGWRLWQAGKMTEAAKKFQEAVKLAPDYENAWNGLGWASFNSGKLPEAKKAFEKVLELNPGHPAALNGLGQLALAEGKLDDAEKYLLKAAPERRPPGSAWPVSICSRASSRRPKNGRRRSRTRARATSFRRRCFRRPKTNISTTTSAPCSGRRRANRCQPLRPLRKNHRRLPPIPNRPRTWANRRTSYRIPASRRATNRPRHGRKETRSRA